MFIELLITRVRAPGIEFVDHLCKCNWSTFLLINEFGWQTPSPEIMEFKQLLKELMRLFGVQLVGDHTPLLAFLDWYPIRQLTMVHSKLDRFLSKVVEEHEEQNKIRRKPESEQDMVDVLLSLRDEQGSAAPASNAMIKGLILVRTVHARKLVDNRIHGS